MLCDTKTKMNLMGTSKQFRSILDTEEFWHEIVIDELPRLKDNINLNQNEFLDLDMYDPNNTDEISDGTRFGLSAKGWKDTVKLYGTFTEELFGKRRSIWNDMLHLKEAIKHPKICLCSFIMMWIALAVFLILFFFAIFYSMNCIRGPVFDKLSDDPNVSNLDVNKVTRSVFSFSLSQSKWQFRIALMLFVTFTVFLYRFLSKKREDLAYWVFYITIGCFLIGLDITLCPGVDYLADGYGFIFNLHNRLVDGPVVGRHATFTQNKNFSVNETIFNRASEDDSFVEEIVNLSNERVIVHMIMWLIVFFVLSYVQSICFGFWIGCSGGVCCNVVLFTIICCGVLVTWVLFLVNMWYNITNSWTVIFIPLFPTIILINVLIFNIRPMKDYEFSAMCSRSIRFAGIAIGSFAGIIIILIPLLCLDGIGEFDPRTSSGEVWKGAERFMSAVVVTDELIERAHKMERNMMLSMIPMMLWFVAVLVVFCVLWYYVTCNVKKMKPKLDLKKKLRAWGKIAPKRSIEEQEKGAEEWRARRMERMQERQMEAEKKAKVEKRKKRRETRENEKAARLIEVTQIDMSLQELSVILDEIDEYYYNEEEKEKEAEKVEEAEMKRLEEEAKKKKMIRTFRNRIFEPPLNPVIHEIWQSILQQGSFSWLP
eukprot:MONOS_4633.1-p1 / transcript=MONOS_4633.1 / gene=MONOS_4633 / organism=Monocercomonoides_exilis_PA203 / gene_product=unspecified product / transcript_product=unspecified product / location=Mono_scaffold00125:61530-63862(-) / protein_length=654 / sequence_SO=supercontig / SO=protein_coding / is_pseudo=false